MSCVYCEPKSRMTIFSACRSANCGPPAGAAPCTADRRAAHGLLGQRPQTRLGAVEILLGLAAGDADGAEHRAVPADERRSEPRDDGHADHLGDGVEEPGPLLV